MTQRVELVQTQMSFVFLTDDYVYKVKKPVNLGYLDYTTLDKRHFFCQREVELNRRLCPDVYLGVVAITRDKGNICLNGRGESIEYAVKMCRLPGAAMLDVLLANNQVSSQMATSVAYKLAEFHRKAETNATIGAFGQLDTVTQNTENAREAVKLSTEAIAAPPKKVEKKVVAITNGRKEQKAAAKAAYKAAYAAAAANAAANAAYHKKLKEKKK